MKRITSVIVALLLTFLLVIPAGASHIDPCTTHQTTGTGSPAVKKGSFSLDADVKEYWTKNGETITLTLTANDLNDTLKNVGGIMVSFKLYYDSAAITLVEKEFEDMLVTAPGGNTAAARTDWTKDSAYTQVTDKKTGKMVVTVLADSYVGLTENDDTYAIKKNGEFVFKLEFTVNAGWTGDILFSVTNAAITDNKAVPKEHSDVDYNFNVKSYAGLLASADLKGDWVNDVAPTCQSVGHATLRCKICNEILGIKEVPATDHAPGEYTEKTKLTCTTDGVYESRCTGCNKLLDTKTEKAQGHKAGELKLKTEMTCTTDEVWESRCTQCNAVVETKTEKAPGHSYGEWEEYSAPTVTKKGEERRYCTVCNGYESRYTDKLPFEGLRGDTDRNGAIGEADADLVKKMLLGEKAYDDMDLLYADGNKNDTLDLGDYIYILRNMK